MSDKGSNLFPNGDLARTNEALGQIISDLRELSAFLGSHGAQNIGCVGMSLGAYVSALWASLDPLSFCIPIVPVVSMSDMAWRLMRNDRELRRQGMSRDLLERAYRLHSPLTYTPKIERDKVLILAGLADRVVPSAQPRLLWEHWGRPEIQWFRGGHLAQFRSKRAMARIIKFFGANGLI